MVTRNLLSIKRRDLTEWLTAYTFLLPSFAVLATFIYYPVFYALYLSFFRWRLLRGDPTFNGLANYQFLLTSEDFWQSVWNTSYFAAGSIPTNMAIALGIALLLNRP